MEEPLVGPALGLGGELFDLGTRAHPVRAGTDHEVVAGPLSVQQRARLPDHPPGLRLVREERCLDDRILLVGLGQRQRGCGTGRAYRQATERRDDADSRQAKLALAPSVP